MFGVRTIQLLLLIMGSLCAPIADATPAKLTVSINGSSGLPTITLGGAPAVSSDFVFWGPNWQWAGLSANLNVLGPYNYALSGASQSLDLALSGSVARPSRQQLLWHFDWDAKRARTGVIGGGISFKFPLLGGGFGFDAPELLPENRGWTWKRFGQPAVTMRFDPPLVAVYYERGQKSEIRALFYGSDIPQGGRRHTATMIVGDQVAIEPTTEERFGLTDEAGWPTGILEWQASPVDLSFLNAGDKPAGKRGLLRAEGGQLVFADGTPARFWGTNVTAYALFGSIRRDDIQRQARRLSQLGFNLVRIHHHDSPWVKPNVFMEGNDTAHLSEGSLQTLDWWIKCLKDEGIYIWLDLHVMRQLKPGDGITDFAEISRGKETGDVKGFNYINASIQAAMQRFNEAYLNHLNVFTGKRYKEEAAIVALLITNENDVTSHFGNSLLPDKNVPRHNAIYMRQAAAFAAQYSLPKDRTWRSWEHGPSKIFLNELEHRFNTTLIAQLRTGGAKAPIVTTSSWGANPLSSLPSLTDGDIVDVHSYGGVGELEKSPIYGPNLMHWIAAGQVLGRPLTVSEWNVSPFPAPDRHSSPVYIAATASLQGWDGLMQYAYSQQALSGPGRAGNWDAFNDPALIATMPAAALLYRRGDVSEAKTTYVFAPTRDQLFYQPISPTNSIALRTAAEKGKLMIAMPAVAELPWLHESIIPGGARLLVDPNASLLDADASEVTSDTGELTRNWEAGIYTVNAPRSQLATGWIGGKDIALADVHIRATTPNATVAVQSLDDKPIAEAKTLLISLGARSVPSAGGKLPFHSEPVTGNLTIRAPAGLKLYARSASSERPLKAPYVDGTYRIGLDPSFASYWLILR